MVEDRRQAICLALTVGIAKDCVVPSSKEIAGKMLLLT